MRIKNGVNELDVILKKVRKNVRPYLVPWTDAIYKTLVIDYICEDLTSYGINDYPMIRKDAKRIYEEENAKLILD